MEIVLREFTDGDKVKVISNGKHHGRKGVVYAFAGEQLIVLLTNPQDPNTFTGTATFNPDDLTKLTG